MILTVEIKDESGKVLYTSIVELEQGKQGGFIRYMDAQMEWWDAGDREDGDDEESE